MKIILNILFFIIFGAGLCYSQRKNNASFCGFKLKNIEVIKRENDSALQFLNINNNDTIVDIGSSSGSFAGKINVIGNFKNVHFILVDIDTNCLNHSRVNNMIVYYESVKGSPFENDFEIVNNKPDSLYLPLNRYKKLWLLNTLHEISDKPAFIQQIADVMQKGGELIIQELLSSKKRKIHGGCHKPLMSEPEITALMQQLGLVKVNESLNPGMVKKIRNINYWARYIKQ